MSSLRALNVLLGSDDGEVHGGSAAKVVLSFVRRDLGTLIASVASCDHTGEPLSRRYRHTDRRISTNLHLFLSMCIFFDGQP